MHLILTVGGGAPSNGLATSNHTVAISLFDSGVVTEVTYAKDWVMKDGICPVTKYLSDKVINGSIPRPDWYLDVESPEAYTYISSVLACMDLHCKERGGPSRFSPALIDDYDGTGLRADLTFDNFVVTDECCLAYTYAFANALNFRGERNPLLITGPRGSGKTHLLHASGNLRLQFEPHLAVRFFDIAEIHESVAEEHDVSAYFDLRMVDMLLLDNVEVLLKPSVLKAALLQGVEQIMDRGGQVVLARSVSQSDQIHQAVKNRGVLVAINRAEATY